MRVIKLYSHRKRVAEADVPNVFIYDALPQTLLVQIVYIWRDAIGPFQVPRSTRSNARYNNTGWRSIHAVFAREHGVLESAPAYDIAKRCETYLLEGPPVDAALDIVELRPSVDAALDLIEASFLYIDRVARKFDFFERKRRGISLTADDAIEELNERFRHAGVGYRFEAGMLIRVDSELLHSEVMRPALGYLHHIVFEGPRAEFLKAHAHYRAGDTKAAITEANNAFESTLKVICEQRGWSYPKGARASDLLRVVRGNGLLPDYLDTSFDQLAATLQSGLPKVRGEEGAHGQGAEARKTPDHVAAYALHLAAANIVFLVEAHQAMK